MPIIKIYDTVERMPRNKFRLHVDGNYVDGYATLDEAEEAMSEWIHNEGLDPSSDGYEWKFKEICVLEAVKMRISQVTEEVR
jgi:hypothetical protein